jgi:hypothetical protein
MLVQKLAEQQVHQDKVTLAEMLPEIPITDPVAAAVQVLLVLLVEHPQFLAVTVGLELTGNL